MKTRRTEFETFDVLGDTFLSFHSRPLVCMISDSFENENKRQNETKNGAHARFEPGTSKSLQKLNFFRRPPARLTRMERTKTIALVCPH